MSNPSGPNASHLAASLIEEQLSALALSIPAVAKAFESGVPNAEHFQRVAQHRKLRLVRTASGGNIVADKAEHPDKAPHVHAPVAALPAQDKHDCLRVLVGNALLTVGMFMQRHDMLDMRTPEFQFLGRVVDALLNANSFRIAPGYMPVASFDGLVIDARLNGMPLFATDTAPGFMEFGDALALLEWMLRYLRGERSYVSGGDAG